MLMLETVGHINHCVDCNHCLKIRYEGESTDIYILLALHKLLLSSQLRLRPVSIMLAWRLTPGFAEVCPSAVPSPRTLSSLQ